MRFGKCFIDTGAGLNALPLPLVRRQGWPIDEGVKKGVKAFKDSAETSIGSVSLEVQLGSSPALHVIDFDVLESATQVVLGFPCLDRKHAVVDYGRR